jgi:hypothetical protein
MGGVGVGGEEKSREALEGREVGKWKATAGAAAKSALEEWQ